MTKKITFGFKYERKRIKKDKILPLLCKDYKPGTTENCIKAKYCRNATYGRKNEAEGVCYGGAKESELDDRKKHLEVCSV